MLFNSPEYLLFLPLVFALYWALNKRNLRWQNVLLLASSYFFYGWWDWRFLSLIAFSTGVDYFAGIYTERAQGRTKKFWLGLSLTVNLGMLGLFKYFDFFVDSLREGLANAGIAWEMQSLEWVLPVGISFYTFQTLSYTMDVYRGKLNPTQDFIAFAAFVSFFPQLVAGPIERATHLIPQINTRRKFSYTQARNGLRLILWGLFKKVVIADTCARYVDQAFQLSEHQSATTLILGAVLFAVQIYGDFSGYSDIAIGTSKLFGIELMSNFRFPYFSRNIGEFWRRWHISLSTWFRDYLYIPLGGSRVSKSKAIRNVFIIFLVSGFWHGANWTFIAWGGIHAMLFIPSFISGNNRKHLSKTIAEGRLFPSFRELGALLYTFIVVTLAWVFFRADSIQDALDYLSGMIVGEWKAPVRFATSSTLLVLFLFAMEWLGRTNERAPFRFIPRRWMRWGLYCLLGWLVLKGLYNPSNFIYFQF
ncbi:MBOAT family O-acyltransferase [Sanyastnella coralliicola]|uniref:MBOAT family O-acyltransferase n=1 Tax=Sanyastnella coralliicola TaxID=3069118 RepID=UPI0027BA6AA0|nr:MBOAT family O-acyltransferase [Longitalea sp. SCSIO 12813]